jgi:hypothetical protein
MLICSTEEELASFKFGEPDFIIYNASQFHANRFTKGMSSTTSVEINFKRMEMVILGTEHAGEMKKGVFSVMHYLQPVKFGQLSLHSSNVGMEKVISPCSPVSLELARLHSPPTPTAFSSVMTNMCGRTLGCSISREVAMLNLSREKEPECNGAVLETA